MYLKLMYLTEQFFYQLKSLRKSSNICHCYLVFCQTMYICFAQNIEIFNRFVQKFDLLFDIAEI